MTIGKGILLFLAFVLLGAFLCLWGMKKSETQAHDLTQNLMHNCANRIIKYLKKHDTITLKDAATLIDGVTAGQFWSKKKLKVQDPKKLAKQVIDFLIEHHYIEPTKKGSYRLKKSKK
ncbi:MAG: hypothetical protein KBS74_04650 [Clostridiales bacterium]|nr:hypothetical protein [Candidatus Cacconaster stercorequi]